MRIFFCLIFARQSARHFVGPTFLRRPLPFLLVLDHALQLIGRCPICHACQLRTYCPRSSSALVLGAVPACQPGSWTCCSARDQSRGAVPLEGGRVTKMLLGPPSVALRFISTLMSIHHMHNDSDVSVADRESHLLSLARSATCDMSIFLLPLAFSFTPPKAAQRSCCSHVVVRTNQPFERPAERKGRWRPLVLMSRRRDLRPDGLPSRRPREITPPPDRFPFIYVLCCFISTETVVSDRR